MQAENCSMGPTLKFSDPDLEEKFIKENLSSNLFVPRLIYLAGAFLYAIFFILDLFLMSGQLQTCIFIRFFLVCPMLLATYCLIGKPFYLKYWRIIFLVNGFAAGGGIVFMMARADSPGNHLYYGGLLLCCLFYYVFEPRQVLSNTLSWGIFIVYLIVSINFINVPEPIFLNNIFIFFFFNIGGMFACYSMELFQRKEFLQKCMIQDQSDRLYQALCEVDQQREKAEKLSLQDPLTNLANRRHFFSVLKNQMDRAQKGEHGLSLILIDIDCFKEVNDRFGHVVGDQVLALVAAIIEDSVRACDLCCRYGGEEFAVLLPGADRNTAEGIGFRLMEQVGSARIPVGDEDAMLSVSVGLASLLPGQEAEMEVFIRRADQALYVAKKSGRNQLRLWSGDGEVFEV